MQQKGKIAAMEKHAVQDSTVMEALFVRLIQQPVQQKGKIAAMEKHAVQDSTVMEALFVRLIIIKLLNSC